MTQDAAAEQGAEDRHRITRDQTRKLNQMPPHSRSSRALLDDSTPRDKTAAAWFSDRVNQHRFLAAVAVAGVGIATSIFAAPANAVADDWEGPGSP